MALKLSLQWMHLKTVVTVGNIGSDADEFKVDEITKSVDIDDAGSGSDAVSDNVDNVIGGEVEGGCTSKGPDSNKLCHWWFSEQEISCCIYGQEVHLGSHWYRLVLDCCLNK